MTTRDAWDPKQYEKFKDERSQPFFDLMDLCQFPLKTVADLGCGPGNLTKILHEASRAEETIGVDNSRSMLEKAAKETVPGLRFTEAGIETWTPPRPVDLLFSNAAIQWLPDHASLFKHLVSLLSPGGQLAVQVPANHDHPSHRVAAEVAAEEPYRSELKGYVRESPVLAPEEYSLLLSRLGCADQRVRLEVYLHPLACRDEVVEWVKGTLLTDYQRRLSPESFADFLRDYRAKLLPRLADDRPYPYAFKRILLWARFS